MDLGEYLYLDTNPLTLNFGDFYYYQNYGSNVLLNTKDRWKRQNILDLTREKSLSEQLNLPVILNTTYRDYWYGINIYDGEHLLYSERFTKRGDKFIMEYGIHIVVSDFDISKFKYKNESDVTTGKFITLLDNGDKIFL